jgi:hypothetical protein
MPTYFYPFLLAIAAFAVGSLLKRRPDQGEADRFGSKILYVVAIGCVVVGIATWWLWNNY